MHLNALCIRTMNLVPKDSDEQMSMFDGNTKRLRRKSVEDAVENIRSRFDKKALMEQVVHNVFNFTTLSPIVGMLSSPTSYFKRIIPEGI